MEQMPNFQLLVSSTDRDEGRASAWRSFGAIASSLLARAEAQRAEMLSDDEHFEPVAWAAE